MEVRDVVDESGLEHGAKESYDKLADELAIIQALENASVNDVTQHVEEDSLSCSPKLVNSSGKSLVGPNGLQVEDSPGLVG